MVKFSTVAERVVLGPGETGKTIPNEAYYCGMIRVDKARLTIRVMKYCKREALRGGFEEIT